MCYKAIDQGAAGVDMGRNIFQSDAPIAMLKAVNAIVHGGENAEQAYQLYLHEKTITVNHSTFLPLLQRRNVIPLKLRRNYVCYAR